MCIRDRVKKEEVKAPELPPLPPIGTEERTYSLFGADPNAPREPEPTVEPEPEGGWPASALVRPDEHELMTPGAGMGHAMDSSEIHPEDAGDHFFDSRVAQQLAKAKEISADASFDEDDELDRVSREAALERAMLDDEEVECAEEDEEIGLCEITAGGSGTGSIEVTRMNATDEEALRSLRVADVIRRDVPRVSALASAADAAREACDYAT